MLDNLVQAAAAPVQHLFARSVLLFGPVHHWSIASPNAVVWRRPISYHPPPLEKDSSSNLDLNK